MNDQQHHAPQLPVWPPLIRAESVPRWVRTRDVVLTVLGWLVLAFLLREVIFLVWDWVRPPFGQLTLVSPPNLAAQWQRLQPFVIAIALLVAWLTFWAMRRRAWLRPRPYTSAQPPPLNRESHAARFGLATDDILSLQASRVVTVHFDAGGRITGSVVDRPA